MVIVIWLLVITDVKQIEKRLMSSFLVSFVFSFILLVIIVFLFSHAQQIDNSKFFYSVVPWGRTGVYKTYDSRNYLIGIGLFGFTPIFFYYLFSKTKTLIQKLHLRRNLIYFVSFLLFLVLILILIKLIASFHIPTLQEINASLDKRRGVELKQNIVYLPYVIISFIAVFWLIRLRITGYWLNAFGTWINRINLRLNNKTWIDLLVVIFIFILIYNPRYQYSFEKLENFGAEKVHQFHHVNFFLGPINEIVNGKTLLVNAHSQYGFLLAYIPALIFKLTGISYSNFVLYNMLLSIIYSCLFYFVLKKVLSNRFLAILGVFAFVKLIFFRPNLTAEIFVFPSSTPIRYFFDILVIGAVYRLYKSYTVKWLLVTGLLVAFSFFYNTEIGISLIIAYLVTLMLQKKRFIYLFIFSFIFLLVYLIISLFTLIRSGHLPNISLLITPLLFFQRGFFDVGMPLIGPWYFIIGIYLATFYMLILKWFKKDFYNFYFLLFLLVYGIFSFFYYIGLSDPNHLVTVLHPAIILFFILFQLFLKNLKNVLKLPLIYQTIIFSFFIIIFGYFFWIPVKLVKIINHRIHTRYFPLNQKYYFWNYPGTSFYLSDNDGSDFEQSAKLIQKYYPNQKNILILSRYDLLLLVMTQKASLVDYFNLEFDTGPTVDSYFELIDRILREKPKYIFVRSKKYHYVFNESIPEIWNIIKRNYEYLESGGVIDVYRLNQNSQTR